MKRYFKNISAAAFSVCLLFLFAGCKPGTESDFLSGFVAGYFLDPSIQENDPASLKSLVVAPGTLEPPFTPDNGSYTVRTSLSTGSIELTAIALDEGSAIRINGTAGISGISSDHEIANLGENTITIEVTAADGMTVKSYKITVIRGITAQQAYIKAANTGAGDLFGARVAISGDTLVIGAKKEDGNATGVVNNGEFSGEDDGAYDDSGAAYVFVRNGTTWSQQAYLKAANPDAGDGFGLSVAISGDTIVVSAPYEDGSATGVTNNSGYSGEDDGDHDDSGAAYVFVRNGTTWSQQAYLKAANTDAGDYFGASVAISDNTIVVGSVYEDSDATGVTNGDGYSGTDPGPSFESGAAYVFVRDGATWSQQAYLKAANTGSWDWYGIYVAISGDTIVVGAPWEDSNGTGVTNDGGFSGVDIGFEKSGAAYVYVRNGTTWSQQAYLKASNTGPGDEFGWRVSVSGDTIAVGAPSEDSDATGVSNGCGYAGTDGAFLDNRGAAYVFVRNGTTWSQQAYLKASNTGSGDWFGGSVGVSGDTIVVGAREEDGNATGVIDDGGFSVTDDGTHNSSGAAYVFVRNGAIWSQQAYLKASNTDAGDWFGIDVAISGDTVVVGSYWEDGNTTGVTNGTGYSGTDDGSSDHSGAVYVFQ